MIGETEMGGHEEEKKLGSAEGEESGRRKMKTTEFLLPKQLNGYSLMA